MNDEQPIIPITDVNLERLNRIALRLERVSRASGRLAEMYEEIICAPDIPKDTKDKIAFCYNTARAQQKSHMDRAASIRAALANIPVTCHTQTS